MLEFVRPFCFTQKPNVLTYSANDTSEDKLNIAYNKQRTFCSCTLAWTWLIF